MTDSEDKWAAARRQMVEEQLRSRGITDERVLEAFEEVPRERFVPSSRREAALADHPLPIGGGQTISQPYVVAFMVQHLAVEPHHRVMDVGSGSGYQTAILARLAAEVHAIERLEELAGKARKVLQDVGGGDNIAVHVGDGTLGLPDQAPFDRIICGAAAPDVPRAWIAQLADGGRIVVPTGGRHVQTLTVLDRQGEAVSRRELLDVRFVSLIGEQGWPGE